MTQPNEQLRRSRERAGLSQAALAQAVGCSVSTIVNAEAGRTRRPLSIYQKRIARALKTPASELWPELEGVA